MRWSWFVALARLLAAALVAGQIAACATGNHYDGLTALPVDRVEPLPTTGDRQSPRLGIAFGGRSSLR